MKLLTKAIKEKLPLLYSQEEVEDPIVHLKLFNPCGSQTWYITEANTDEEDTIMFCYMTGGHVDEFGYQSLNEMQSFKGRFGLGIERDIHFKPMPLSECKRTHA